MRAAAWLLVLLIGTAVSVALPGATIFFLFAPAVALVGVALERRSPRTAFALAVLGDIDPVRDVRGVARLIETLLVDGPVWAVAPLAALAALPALIELGRRQMRPAICRAARHRGSASGWLRMIVPRSSAERPVGFGIDYFRDADHEQARYWGIADQAGAAAGRLPRRMAGRACCLTVHARAGSPRRRCSHTPVRHRETGCNEPQAERPTRPARPLPGRR